MSSVIPFVFNGVDFCVVTINEKSWTRSKQTCSALEYRKGRARDVLKRHVSIENKQHKHELEGRAAAANLLEWPNGLSQPDDYYINEEGMYELVFSIQQPKAKHFRKLCCNVLFPYVRQQFTKKYRKNINKPSQAMTIK